MAKARALPSPAAPRRRRRSRHVARALAASFAAVVAAAVTLGALLGTEAGVALLASELAARSGGALAVDGVGGTLIGTVRARRIAWTGPAGRVVATDVALTWRPLALLSRGIVVRALGARALAIELQPSDTTMPAPASLELPVDVAIGRLAVGTLSWRVGTSEGTIEGLAFGYAGGGEEHRLSDLEFVTRAGILTGNATLGARAPFPVDARMRLLGDAALREARVDFVATGTLDAIAVDASGTAGEGRASAHASVAPFAPVPLVSLAVDARDVDLAAWDRVLPVTRIAATVAARPGAGGLEGSATLANAIPGNLDAGRTPVRALSTRFAWTPETIALDGLAAELEGGARATGRARIALGGRATGGRWNLDLRDVDLSRIHGALAATRLSGTVAADLDPALRTVRGNLADRGFAGGVAIDFDAAFDERSVVLRHASARAGGGEVALSGRVERDGSRAFSLDATATKLDPSRFAALPAGSLDGKARATGTLGTPWRVDADVAIAAGSRLAGITVGGTARGSVAPARVHDATVHLDLGSASLLAAGSLGEPGDRMAVTLDARDLASLVPLLPPVAPRTIAGELHVKAELSGRLPTPGLDATAKGTALKLPGGVAIAALDAHAAIAPPAGAGADFASRALRVDAEATGVHTPSGDVGRASAHVAGTLAAHAATLSLDGGEIGLDAAAHGGVRADPSKDAPGALTWTGTIDSVAGRGPWALRLATPAPVSLARRKASLGEAHFTVADGTVDVREFAWEEGRVTSHGRFASVPLATLARLAGRPLPVRSTMTLAGEWSLAAAPRLDGTVSVRRERGDLWLVREADAASADLAAGITELEIVARVHDDAIDATARYRAARGGSADATLAIGAVAGAPPGRLAPDAPLALTLVADLPSLAILQPWAGTTAVIDGALHADLAARGTLRNAPVAGTVAGTRLRIDAPQYGLHFADGRVRARIANRRVTLDELAFTAGEGSFHATGTLAAPADTVATSAAHLDWRAEKFRVFNRPDFNLVASGAGEIALAKGRLSLTGRLCADEGRIVHQFDANATLGPDVVVKGWDRPSPDTSRATDVPLDIDVALDFGERLTFSGHGLETGLAGEVRVRNGPGGFTGRGELRAVNGTYFAYGQRLAIDPGRLIFDGPLDNPALDILALRRNAAVEAGVHVTGTVRVPIVALTSNPPVPDSEKLAWLVLGRGLDRASGTDVAALSAASAALLGPNARPVTASIAQSVGLDDISIRSGVGAPRGASAASPTATGQVISIGKRITDKLSVAWEQGLTVATNALRVEYAISSTLSVRAEAGTVSGLGVYYRRNFD